MENQISVGDKNNQQVGQNPVSRLVQIPEKPRVNHWMILTIVFALLFLGTLIWYFFSFPFAGLLKPAGNLKDALSVIPSPTAPITSSNNTEKAIKLLESIPEIQIIKDSVIKAGRKPFFTPEGENGDVVTISLRESFPDDQHTSRIDTFNINILSKIITISDVVTNKDISLDEWKKTVNERFFSKYSAEKIADVLVQDGSYYGPPFDPNLYQLEIQQSFHLFAKSDTVNLKKYLGKRVRVHYREVKGIVMGEQQLVIVDSIE